MVAIWIIVSLVVTIIIYRYGKGLDRRKRILIEIRKMQEAYEKVISLQDKQIELLSNKKESPANDNPFGSYLFPVIKVSELYRIKEMTDKHLERGEISPEQYNMRSEWLIKEIEKKTGDPDWDDTTLKIEL